MPTDRKTPTVSARILADLSANPGSTNKEIGHRIGANPSTVQIELVRLHGACRVVRVGRPYEYDLWPARMPALPAHPRRFALLSGSTLYVSGGWETTEHWPQRR